MKGQRCGFKRDGKPCPEAATNYMINESDQGGRVKKLACPHHFRTGRSAITRETGRLV